jgi:hypothetical protein
MVRYDFQATKRGGHAGVDGWQLQDRARWLWGQNGAAESVARGDAGHTVLGLHAQAGGTSFAHDVVDFELGEVALEHHNERRFATVKGAVEVGEFGFQRASYKFLGIGGRQVLASLPPCKRSPENVGMGRRADGLERGNGLVSVLA